MGVSSSGLFGFLARLGRPPASDSDADLLNRFVRFGDESAFTGIVRRHGPMVLAVCRRRLGQEPDAEDAFQAVFLTLARSAGSIGRGESLPGWLYRVAYLISLKAAGRRARHPTVALPAGEVPMPNPSIPTCEADDLKAVIDSELAGLSEKFRSAVVLCLIEGRTNVEAAGILGVPVGTIDSRLNTARKKLQAALTRRGVAVGVGMTLTQMLGGPLSATDAPQFVELVSNTVRAVLANTTGLGAGAVSPTVAELAHGVATMTTTKLRLLAALGVTLGVLGGAGAGIYLATAANPTQAVKAANPNTTLLTTGDNNPAAPVAAQKPYKDIPKATAAALDRPFGLKVQGSVPLAEILGQIEELTDLVVRVDVAAFQRLGQIGVGSELGNANEFLKMIYDTQPLLPRKVEKLPIRDVLNDILAQVPHGWPCTYQIRGSQLVIVPAYLPCFPPGVNPLSPRDEDLAELPRRQISEQIYGGVVTVSADRKPLAEILADLRKQTGANIILDPRCEKLEEHRQPLTISLSDVRLFDALRVIADMAELKMVYVGNIYYVTTPSNAKTFQPPTPRPPSESVGGTPPEPGK